MWRINTSQRKMHGMMSKEILVPKGRDIVCFRACDNSLKRALMLRRIGVCLGKVSTTEASSVSMSSRTEPGLEHIHGKHQCELKRSAISFAYSWGFLISPSRDGLPWICLPSPMCIAECSISIPSFSASTRDPSSGA